MSVSFVETAVLFYIGLFIANTLSLPGDLLLWECNVVLTKEVLLACFSRSLGYDCFGFLGLLHISSDGEQKRTDDCFCTIEKKFVNYGRRVEPKITRDHHLSRFISKPAEPLSIHLTLRLRRVEEHGEPPDQLIVDTSDRAECFGMRPLLRASEVCSFRYGKREATSLTNAEKGLPDFYRRNMPNMSTQHENMPKFWLQYAKTQALFLHGLP